MLTWLNLFLLPRHNLLRLFRGCKRLSGYHFPHKSDIFFLSKFPRQPAVSTHFIILSNEYFRTLARAQSGLRARVHYLALCQKVQAR